jgi:hypothetical protein
MNFYMREPALALVVEAEVMKRSQKRFGSGRRIRIHLKGSGAKELRRLRAELKR